MAELSLAQVLTQDPWDTSDIEGQKTFKGAVIYDAETHIKSIAGRNATPFYGPMIVLDALKPLAHPDAPVEFMTGNLKLNDTMTLIGHNVKFDCLHNYAEFRRSGAKLWCTQLAEHALHGMHHGVSMTSLNELSAKYGGFAKTDVMAHAWSAGYDTNQIHLEIVQDYLEGDILNTEKVFKGQEQVILNMKQVDKRKLIACLKVRMKALAAAAEIEWNGIKFDKDKAYSDIAQLSVRKEEATAAIFQITGAHEATNLGSSRQMSCLLFGGTYTVEVQVPWFGTSGEQLRHKTIETWPLVGGVAMPTIPVGATQDVFKSGIKVGQGKTKKVEILGEPKTKKGKIEVTVPRIFTPKAEWANANGYSTSAEVLAELEKQQTPLTQWIKQFNRCKADLTSYGSVESGKGLLSFVGPDNFIRANINKALTNTGRASSSKPNLQNLPDYTISNVTLCFISRFPEGKLWSWDFSQIEVNTHYAMSGSKDMIKKLNEGLDLHLDKLSFSTGKPYDQLVKDLNQEKYWSKNPPTEAELTTYGHPVDYITNLRRAVKPVTFQGIFNASPKTIAVTTGIPEGQVKQMLAGVNQANPERDQFLRRVQATALANQDDKGRGYYQDATGAILSWEIMGNRIKPTELANRVTQAYAAFIKDLVIGYIFDLIKDNPRILLVSEVHDEYVFDVHPEELKTFTALKQYVEANVRTWLSEHIGFEYPCNFKMGMEQTYG
jgi:DNA polymerase I-like protein with 3'-5' exonuclease and polymerase domains